MLRAAGLFSDEWGVNDSKRMRFGPLVFVFIPTEDLRSAEKVRTKSMAAIRLAFENVASIITDTSAI